MFTVVCNDTSLLSTYIINSGTSNKDKLKSVPGKILFRLVTSHGWPDDLARFWNHVQIPLCL